MCPFLPGRPPLGRLWRLPQTLKNLQIRAPLGRCRRRCRQHAKGGGQWRRTGAARLRAGQKRRRRGRGPRWSAAEGGAARGPAGRDGGADGATWRRRRSQDVAQRKRAALVRFGPDLGPKGHGRASSLFVLWRRRPAAGRCWALAPAVGPCWAWSGRAALADACGRCSWAAAASAVRRG